MSLLNNLMALTVFLLVEKAIGDNRTFTIENDKFMKDGETFQIISGSFHYSRIPAAGWDDRLKRLAAMGLNTIQTNVPWNWHEDTEGTFDFEGDRDLPHFLSLCKQNNLSVLLGTGPYTCPDWEFGGLPWWLLKNGGLNIRTYDSSFTDPVTKYFSKLHAVVKPHLYENGGNVVMVQIESEYGSFGDVTTSTKNAMYLEYLLNETRKNLGDDILVYTSDTEPSGLSTNMQKGSIKGDDVITLGEHGSGIGFGTSCLAQSVMNGAGKNPCFDTQYYTGGPSFWGQSVINSSTASAASNLDKGLKNGYSANLYMAFGGTNLGWYAGAIGGLSSYNPYVTSYDYDAPISESGDHGYGSDKRDKFKGILKITSKYYDGDVPPEPEPEKRSDYGSLTLTEQTPLLSKETLDTLTKWNNGSKTLNSAATIPMEFFNQSFGTILYRGIARATGDTMSFGYPSDRVIIFVGGMRQGAGGYFRSTFSGSLTLINPVQLGETVDILVESMGRIGSGTNMIDRKGLASEVYLNGSPLTTTWEVFNLQLSFDDISQLKFSPIPENPKPPSLYVPTIFKGYLNIPSEATSCYIEASSFTKGSIWINGVNIGRYWNNMGPQQRLYIYKSILKTGDNSVHVLEYDFNNGTKVTFNTEQKWSA
eukprot:TRINITY_DN958_c0_g1_i1.p1 TRINITY_DN958_c0_g1~~TRINITY_DN958_c0_g1_i1.p1  ORF type:complete len:647 (+),score=89.11 TRINITY_DN958_c0_g1_i1:53-1993(+)